MSDEAIHKLTIYKLHNLPLKSIKLTGYKKVATGAWGLGKKKYKYRLFFHKNSPHPTGWFGVFKPLNLRLTSRDIPQTIVSGFILVIQIERSLFGVTGGVGHVHLRKQLKLKHRFGVELAQRILALPELRGLSQRDTGGIVNALDRAFRGIYNPQGDINNLKRVLTHVRGTLQKTNPLQATIGKSIQASDALTVTGRKKFEDVIKLLVEVNKLLLRGKAKLKIPQLEHIDGKLQRSLLKELEIQLAKTLLNYESDEHSLFLDNEDIGYLPDRIVKYELRYERRHYELETFVEVFQSVRGLLKETESTDDQLEALHRMKLKLEFDDGFTELRSLLYFICGDIVHDNNVFFLNNTQWYRASDEFLNIMATELDNIECMDPAALGILEWDKARFPEEKDFNAAHNSFIVLDRQLIKVLDEKGPIEFCDLFSSSDTGVRLIHVKNETGAALRGLFAQGFVSAKLYAESQEYRSKIHNGDLQTTGRALTRSELANLRKLKLRHRREMKIIFAIYDDKKSHTVAPNAKSTSEILKGTLTTFAKVDLLDRVASMRAIGYDVALSRIKPYPKRKR